MNHSREDLTRLSERTDIFFAPAPSDRTRVATDSNQEKVGHVEDAWAETLYREAYPSIRSFVRRHSGDEAEAEDIFQDAILVFSKKRSDPDFRLSCAPSTFLFAVARNLWLKRLRERRRRSRIESLPEIFSPAPYVERATELGSWVVQHWIPLITPTCQSVIVALFVTVVPIERLMEKMGWKNRHTAQNLKYKCLEQLRRVAERNQPALPDFE